MWSVMSSVIWRSTFRISTGTGRRPGIGSGGGGGGGGSVAAGAAATVDGGKLPAAPGASLPPGSSDDSCVVLARVQPSVAARAKATRRERIDPPTLFRS